MKFSGNIIKSLLLSTLTATTLLLSTSCIREDLPVDCAEQGKEVTLQISIGASPTTKAQSDVTLTPIESDLYSLRIYAFYNGALAGHEYIYNNGQKLIAEGSTAMDFYMDIPMYVIGDQKLDFYVIANEISTSGLFNGTSSVTLGENTPEAVLNNLRYSSYDGLTGLEFDFPKGMPNVTKKSYILVMDEKHVANSLDPDHKDHSLVTEIYEVGADRTPENKKTSVSFNLERPFGKLNVYAAKDAGASDSDKLYVTDVVIRRNGSRMYQYLFPQSLSTLAAVARHSNPEPRDLLSASSVEVTTKVTSAGSTTLSEYTSVADYDYYPYENPFGSKPTADPNYQYWAYPTYNSDSGTELETGTIQQVRGNVLEVKYYYNNPNDIKTGTVYLPPIDRNTYYGVYCTMTRAGGVNVTYEVAEWDDKRGTPGVSWELDYDYPDYIGLTPMNNEDPKTVKREIYHGETSGFFQVNLNFYGPTGGKWRPYIREEDGAYDDFDWEVWQGDKKILSKSQDGYCGPSMTVYNIRVIATNEVHYLVDNGNPVTDENGKTINRKVHLGIQFKPGWDPDNNMLLLINGVDDEDLKWGAGSGSAELLLIEQVENPAKEDGGITEGE